MHFIDLLRLSFDALRANKLRTTLTVFGIVIGVTSVIAIVSIVVGMNTKVTGLINQMGTTTFVISKFSMHDYASDDAYREARKRKNIRFKDIKAVEKGCEDCQYVGGRVFTFRRVKYGSEKVNGIPIAGMTYNVNKITDFEIAEGRFHTEFEDEHKRQLVVIGDKIKRDLFTGIDPIGKVLQIGTHKYEVIGTVKPRGSIMGKDLDNFVIIPLTTLLKNYGSNRSVDIFVNARSEELVPDAIDQARVIMRARRHVDFNEKDNFGITTSDDLLDLYRKITGTVQIVAIAIPLIALIVAGIVVMNIMMVSVTERTREIGIRKSLGAHRKHILLQFMTEALMMSMTGGAIGIALGIFLARVLSNAGDLPFVVSRVAIMGGVFISTGIGVIFGSYPAYKGAKLDPVEAMRFE